MPTNTTIGGGSTATATAIYRLPSSVAGTNAAVIKSSPGTVFTVAGFNANAAARFIKLYNKATAPVVGTDVPLWVGILPAQDSASYTIALTFSAGIAIAITTGPKDNDSGSILDADILALNIAYS